ncbi:MAG TPA: hypothetical protein VG206_19110 [Terriglobia bacterium]|nr:hypothetical protein [Terriglobia bacterium]
MSRAARYSFDFLTAAIPAQAGTAACCSGINFTFPYPWLADARVANSASDPEVGLVHVRALFCALQAERDAPEAVRNVSFQVLP